MKLTYHAIRPEDPQVGDCWPAPWLTGGEGFGPRTFFLSDDFIARWEAGDRGRAPLIVRIPGAGGAPAGATDLCIDGPHWREGVRQPTGWSVVLEGPLTDGETPNLTVHPSIDIGGGWHGWLQHGVLHGGGLP